jgi:hypothetical protein
MRSVGLDLGARHIAYCEVRDGKVVARVRTRAFGLARLSPETRAERCRWHLFSRLSSFLC